MQTYGEFRPTSLDPAGLGLDDQQHWLVLPTSRTRDSDELAESNFATALEILGGEGEDVEVHRFGHWGPGWFEIIIVRPDTDAAAEAASIECALADYPVLDDEDYSRREWEAHSRAVASYCSWVAGQEWLDLRDSFDAGQICERLQWHAHDRTPEDDEILEALRDLDFIDHVYTEGEEGYVYLAGVAGVPFVLAEDVNLSQDDHAQVLIDGQLRSVLVEFIARLGGAAVRVQHYHPNQIELPLSA